MSDEVASGGAPDMGFVCLGLLLKFLGTAVDPEKPLDGQGMAVVEW